MSQKESTLIILSNGNSMLKKYQDSSLSRLDFGKDSIRQLLRQKLIFSVKRDEIGVILTNENEDCFLPLTNYSPELLEQIENINCEENSGDIFLCVENAIEIFQKKYKKLKWNKKIFLITDGESPSQFDQERIEFLAEKIDKNDIKMNIICVDFFDELENDDDENIPMSTETKSQQNTKKLLKSLEQKTKNIKIFTSNQANYIYHQFKKKKISPVTKFRGPLIISPQLQLDVMIYTKTTQTNLPSLKKYSKVTPFSDDPNVGTVINERVYYIHDDPEKNPIDKEFMAKAYYYGNSLVPVGPTDEIRFKNEEPKCLKAIGFTDAFRVPRHYFMSGVDLLIPNPASEGDVLALQSLVTEMRKMNKVVVARFVYRQNADPKLVVLTPHQSKRGPVFYLNVLPTVEDIRDFQFSSLDQCSAQQEEVVGKFIDSLDLEQNEELLKPNETFNPVLQYFYQCLEAKALDKSEDLPPLDEAIARYLIPNKKLFENNKYASFLHKMFKIKEKDQIDDKKKRVFWKEIIQNELDTTVTQQRIEEKLNANKPEDKTSISAVTPIEDFKEMVGNKKVDYTVKAMNLMSEMVIKFIRDSFKGSYFVKAIECIKVLRQTAIEEDEVDLFNDFLNELKKLFPKEKFLDFWLLFVDNKITLISEDENEKSKFTETQAQSWLNEIKGKEVITSTLQEMDNLLEDID